MCRATFNFAEFARPVLSLVVFLLLNGRFDYRFVSGLALFIVFDTFMFVKSTVSQIAAGLKIRVFSIVPVAKVK